MARVGKGPAGGRGHTPPLDNEARQVPDRVEAEHVGAALVDGAHLRGGCGESEGRISVDAAMERFVESPVFFNRTMEFDILRNPATLAECLDVVLSSDRG